LAVGAALGDVVRGVRQDAAGISWHFEEVVGGGVRNSQSGRSGLSISRNLGILVKAEIRWC
jgi:hypothetical protein